MIPKHDRWKHSPPTTPVTYLSSHRIDGRGKILDKLRELKDNRASELLLRMKDEHPIIKSSKFRKLLADRSKLKKDLATIKLGEKYPLFKSVLKPKND